MMGARHRSLAAAALLALVGCKAPLVTLKEHGSTALTVYVRGSKSAPDLEEALEQALRQELSTEVRILQGPPSAKGPHVSISLIPPAPAVVKSYWVESRERLVTKVLTFGLGPVDEADELKAMGLDRDDVNRAVKERKDTAIFSWGPFQKTAQRGRLEELGYTPILLTGCYDLADTCHQRGLGQGIFFGWDAVKYMKPIPGRPAEPTREQVFRASAEGLAAMLRARWSKRF